MPSDMPPWGLTWGALILALLVTVFAAGRLTRLITADHWPPVDWFRAKWDAHSDRLGGWWLLAACHWCLGPWMTAIVGLWAVLSHLHWTWWIFNGWLALSYLTSILVHHDEGPDTEET